MADDLEVVTPDTPAAPTVLGTRDIITAIVKDDDDGARAAFHQVLQTRMRDRINPPEVVDLVDPDAADPDAPPADPDATE